MVWQHGQGNPVFEHTWHSDNEIFRQSSIQVLTLPHIAQLLWFDGKWCQQSTTQLIRCSKLKTVQCAFQFQLHLTSSDFHCNQVRTATGRVNFKSLYIIHPCMIVTWKLSKKVALELLLFMLVNHTFYYQSKGKITSRKYNVLNYNRLE